MHLCSEELVSLEGDEIANMPVWHHLILNEDRDKLRCDFKNLEKEVTYMTMMLPFSTGTTQKQRERKIRDDKVETKNRRTSRAQTVKTLPQKT